MSGSPPQASPLRRAARDALPLFAAQGVAFIAGYGLNAALLVLLEPTELADFGRLREALRWVCALALFGLPTGLLRFAAEHRKERGSLFVTTATAVTLISLLVASVVVLWPQLREALLLESSAGEMFRLFVWKVPFVALFAVALAAAHAQGALRHKGGLEAMERVAVLVGSVGGALTAGLPGLVVGSLAGSAIAAGIALVATWPKDAALRIRREALAGIVSVGRSRVGVQVLETLRPVVLLQILTVRGGGDAGTALLYGGMLFTLPLIALPERLAQAVFPSMLDEEGETADLDARSRRLTRDLTLVAVPLLALAGGALTLLLPLLKGGAYTSSVTTAWILLVGVGAQSVVAHLGYVILVRHRLHWEAVASGLVLAAMACVAWWLVPLWGANGAAGALSAAMVLRAALLWMIARRPARS
jgi:O-antigen/teichoic acid export membrane protein